MCNSNFQTMEIRLMPVRLASSIFVCPAMARRWASLGKWMLLMSIALGAAFFGPQPPQQSPKQGFAPPDSSQLYSLFSAGVVAVSSISISTYKDAVTVQVGTYKDAVTVQVAAIDKKIEAIDKEIKVIEKANDRRIDAIEKKTEAIEKKTEAIDKKTEKTEATLVLVVVAVVASVVAGFVLERQRAKD